MRTALPPRSHSATEWLLFLLFHFFFLSLFLRFSWETLDAEKSKSEKKSNAEEKSKDE